MIDVKSAVARALEFVGDMYAKEKLRDARLEEVELSEDGAIWHITVSYLRDLSPSALTQAIEGSSTHEYKGVHVAAEDGKVLSMTIRRF